VCKLPELPSLDNGPDVLLDIQHVLQNNNELMTSVAFDTFDKFLTLYTIPEFKNTAKEILTLMSEKASAKEGMNILLIQFIHVLWKYTMDPTHFVDSFD
jgi:hypothetical protein